MHHTDNYLPVFILFMLFWAFCIFMTVFTTVSALVEYFAS